MAKPHQRTPLIRLLVRLGWQRDPDFWTVHCRDQWGRRARVVVALDTAGVALASTSPEPLELTPMEVGQLRGALRDALLNLDMLTAGKRVGAPARSARRQQLPRLRVRRVPATDPD